MVLEKLRDEFLKLLTVDSDTADIRHRDYNRALFATADDGGYSIPNRVTLNMILRKFDRAVEEVKGDAD